MQKSCEIEDGGDKKTQLSHTYSLLHCLMPCRMCMDQMHAGRKKEGRGRGWEVDAVTTIDEDSSVGERRHSSKDNHQRERKRLKVWKNKE